MNTSEYKKLVNDLRKSNKDKWVNFSEKVGDFTVGIKFFNTWIQRMEIVNSTYIVIFDTSMYASVKDFNNCIDKAMYEIIKG